MAEWLNKARKAMDTIKNESTVGHLAQKNVSRRDFLKLLGVGTATMLASCVPATVLAPTADSTKSPEGTKVPEIGFGEYDCSVEGNADWFKDQEAFIDTLGPDFVPGMESNTVHFQAKYFLDKYSTNNPAKATFIALPPMTVVQSDGSVKQTEDQVWFKDPSTERFERLGYVKITDQSNRESGIMWVKTDRNLKLYDDGLVPEANQAITEGDWLISSSLNGVVIMRPPEELLVGREGWGPLSSCLVSNQPNDLLTPTPSGADEQQVKFSQVNDISLKRAAGATVTATPEAPEVSYNCPLNPEDPNMSRISLKEDMQSGRLASWVESLPDFSAHISDNPEKLDYQISRYDTDGSNNLSARRTDDPGWAEIHSKVLGICKINPSEFGLQGKNDAYIIISVAQDKNNKRMAQFTLTGKEHINSLYYGGSISDPKNGINPMNKLNNTSNVVLIMNGAAPGKEDDLRPLGVNTDFYGAQGTVFDNKTGLDAVNAAFDQVAASDTFSDEIVKFFKTNIFYTAQYRDLK